MAIISNVNIGVGEKLGVAFPKVHSLVDNYNLLQQGEYNVLDYSADPTGVLSSSAAIQAAVDAGSTWSATHANMGATVYIPAGYYYITVAITLKSYVHIVCDKGALFYVAASYAGSMWQNPVGNLLEYASITGGIHGETGSTRTWKCIDLNSSDDPSAYIMFCTFENMKIFNANVAINMNVTNDGWINGCNFLNILIYRPIKGIMMRQAAGGSGMDGNFFCNTQFQPLHSVTTHCIDMQCVVPPSHNKFVNTSFWDLDAAILAIDTNGMFNEFVNNFITIPATSVNDTGSYNRIEYDGGYYSPIERPLKLYGFNGSEVNRLRIETAGDAGTWDAPNGDVAIKFRSYWNVAPYDADVANYSARILVQNTAGTNDGGSDMTFQVHGAASSVSYLNALRLDYNGHVRLYLAGIPVHANNAAAIVGGLAAGDLYRTNADPDLLCIVH